METPNPRCPNWLKNFIILLSEHMAEILEDESYSLLDPDEINNNYTFNLLYPNSTERICTNYYDFENTIIETFNGDAIVIDLTFDNETEKRFCIQKDDGRVQLFEFDEDSEDYLEVLSIKAYETNT